MSRIVTLAVLLAVAREAVRGRRNRSKRAVSGSGLATRDQSADQHTRVSLPDLFDVELRAGVDKTVQEELAKLMNLAPDVERCGQRHLLIPLRYAVKGILLEPANLTFAQEIRKDIEQRVRAVPVLGGLGVLLGVVISCIPLIIALSPKTFFGFDRTTLALVVLAGAVGAVISILVRIREFVTNPERSTWWTGFSRPIIGIAFALFSFFAVESGLLPITIENGKENATYGVIAFLAGFSERFARDVVRRTETRIAPLPSGSAISRPLEPATPEARAATRSAEGDSVVVPQERGDGAPSS